MILHIFIYNVMSDFSGTRRVSEGRVNNFTCCKLQFTFWGGWWSMSKISFQNRKLLNDHHHPPISTQWGGGGQCAKSLISEYETKSQIEAVC